MTARGSGEGEGGGHGYKRATLGYCVPCGTGTVQYLDHSGGYTNLHR